MTDEVKKYNELGHSMTEYGAARLSKGLEVSCLHDHEYIKIQILKNGDVMLSEGWATFRIKKDFRRSLADALSVHRIPGHAAEEDENTP